MQSNKLATPKARILYTVFFVAALLLAMTACSPQQNEGGASEPSASEADAAATTDTEAAGEEAKDEPVQIDIDFSMESDCTVCHKKAMESEQNALAIASIHSKEGSTSCITCHNQEKELTEVHANAESTKEPLRLKSTTVSEETCLSCHGSYEALAEKTTGSTILTDANGLTVNPHTAKQLNAEHEEEITCTKCHSEHNEIDDSKSYSYCMNCHHMKVFECNTCHEAD